MHIVHLILHLNEFAQMLHIMGMKFQIMFINIICGLLKDFYWFPGFVISISVTY